MGRANGMTPEKMIQVCMGFRAQFGEVKRLCLFVPVFVSVFV